MDLGLKGKNAIVLGGTRGIGRAIAATLAGEGTHVAVCARNADQVAATVAELKASGINAFLRHGGGEVGDDFIPLRRSNFLRHGAAVDDMDIFFR